MELDITKSEVYKTELHELTDWDEYLLKESGLPMVPVTPDSYSRLCKFDKVQQGLEH